MVETFTFQNIKTQFDKPMNIIRWKILAGGVFLLFGFALFSVLVYTGTPSDRTSLQSSRRLGYIEDLKSSDSLEFPDDFTWSESDNLHAIEDQNDTQNSTHLQSTATDDSIGLPFPSHNHQMQENLTRSNPIFFSIPASSVSPDEPVSKSVVEQVLPELTTLASNYNYQITLTDQGGAN